VSACVGWRGGEGRGAHSAFDGFGAVRRRDEAARELRRLGHRVLRPAQTTDDDPLTAREREIAKLAASGRTNREIAEELVLSPRIIEAHLRSIYGKLDVRSRVELTRHLAEDAAVPGGTNAQPESPARHR
jgi:DNA-binding CsgD family transcriptional regulator